MTCLWLGISDIGGYFCGYYGPCPALDIKDCDCPVIGYARRLEESFKNPEVIEREKLMLRDTI